MKAEIYRDFYQELAIESVFLARRSFFKFGCWNGYIYIPERKLTEKFKDIMKEVKKVEYNELVNRKYFNYFLLDNYIDIHGGVTFFEIQETPEIFYKIGCDYAHYNDNPRKYQSRCSPQ